MTTLTSRRTLVVAALYATLASILLTLLLTLACSGRYSRSSGQTPLPAPEYRVDAPAAPISNDAHEYRGLLAKLESERAALALRYQEARSETEKNRIVDQARAAIVRAIYTEMFPDWYGTAWDFNGTTEVPRQGKIACGYFVTTVLRDAGWKVQRARLAQQASENIILSLTSETYIKRFRRVAIDDFIRTVKEWGPGIYVVGLDIHTGFIVNSGDEVYFVHASYAEPFAVVKERALDSKILQASKYRVLGRITADDEFIAKWLLRKEIVTRGV
jgi:hypothetical protein